jgi:probable rRNA maturation factor
VKITIKNLQKKIPIYPAKIKKSILKAFKSEGAKALDITVSFVTDRVIRKLNLKYLNENRSTDVLAFNLSENRDPIIGDIIISADTAKRNARIYKTSNQYELNLYSVHGCLHLLGYDDNNPKNSKIMRLKESLYANP